MCFLARGPKNCYEVGRFFGPRANKGGAFTQCGAGYDGEVLLHSVERDYSEEGVGLLHDV